MSQKNYALWLHGKQGDHLADHLRGRKKNAAAALELWASNLDACANHVRRLATILKGKKIGVEADGNFIFLSGDEKALRTAADAGLIEEDEP